MKRISRNKLVNGNLYYVDNEKFNEKFIIRVIDDKRLKSTQDGQDNIFKLKEVKYIYSYASGKSVCLNRKSFPILRFDKIYLLEHDSEMLGIVL